MTKTRRPGRPRNRGRTERASASAVAHVVATSPTSTAPLEQLPARSSIESAADVELDEPALPAASARPIERIGSAHARAQAVVILGPATDNASEDGEIQSMVDLEASAPDLESEPVAVREVIRRDEFPSKLVAIGGVYARILGHYEPARYRVLWVGAAGETLAQEVYVRPDPEADLKKVALEREHQQEEAQRLQTEAWERARKAEDEAVIRAWVRGWLRHCLLRASRRVALGNSTDVLAGIEKWLTENADSFVRVVRSERVLEKRQFPRGIVRMIPRVRVTRPHPVPLCPPELVWRHLKALLPVAPERKAT